MNFFTGISTVCFTPKNTCACMHAIQDVRSCEYTQPPWAFTRTWATTRSRVKRVDMLYLGAYTEGGRYSRLLQYSVLAQEEDSLETLFEYLLR